MSTKNTISILLFITFLVSICYGSGVLYGINYDDDQNINLQQISTDPWAINIINSNPGFYAFEGFMDIDKVNQVSFIFLSRINCLSFAR